MFDYVNRLQLAAKDSARRAVMKVVAGLILAIGAGFLLAALWSYLAINLGWGPMLASLAIGGGFVAIALILLMVSNHQRHAMPTTDDLKREVEARVTLATDAAVERARTEASRLVDLAGSRAQSLLDDAGDRVGRIADDTGQRFYGLARSVGITPQNMARAKADAGQVRDGAKRAADSNAGSMAKLIGAFAIGVTLAAKLQERRQGPKTVFDDDDLM